MSSQEPNQYKLQRAAHGIDGYYLPSRSKRGGDVEEFERAKLEYLSTLADALAVAKGMTFNQFTQRIKHAKGNAA